MSAGRVAEGGWAHGRAMNGVYTRSQMARTRRTAARPFGTCGAFLPVILIMGVVFAGCAAYRPANAPLVRWDPDYGYRPRGNLAARPLGDVVLFLAFSGGGTRAAALAYGVLQELRDTRIVVNGVEKRLLDEVDVITSVSGGSFTAAYYGLYGDRIFADFEERFLRRNIQSQLIKEMLSPINWMRMASTFFDRSELAVRLYDRDIFDGANFEDLQQAGGPFVQINATDLAAANRFTFFQPQFDLICSDLGELEVARAVAASSAVPGLFTPLTLRSYAGECGFVPPPWIEQARQERTSSRRTRVAQVVDGYLSGKRKYVHLVDGGVSDNLGLRGPLENITLSGGLRQRFDQLGTKHPPHIAVIVVNAEVHPEPKFSLSPAAPSLATLINAVSDVQIYGFNFETLELLRASLDQWVREVPPDDEGRAVQSYVASVDFESITDPQERAYFNDLPTTFNLDDEQVDRLTAAGRASLRRSADFQRLIGALTPANPQATYPRRAATGACR